MYVNWGRLMAHKLVDGTTVLGHVNYTAPDLSWFEVRTADGPFVTLDRDDVLSSTPVKRP